MRKFCILACCLMLLIPSLGLCWDRNDTLLQATYLSLLVADRCQTVYIAKHPDKFYERNKILGKHPSVGEVNSYFLGLAAVHTGIAYVLPQPYRKVFQYITIGGEAFTVTRNVVIGVKMSF